MGETFKLNSFQLLTPGLYSGDKVVLHVNYVVQCFSFWRYGGWKIKILGTLGGQLGQIDDYDVGNYAYRNNAEMVFTGVMPAGKPLQGKLKFIGSVVPPLEYSTFAEIDVTIPNLDDVAPDGGGNPPPAICTEGQTKCVGTTQMVCRNSTWITKEYNSVACGYVPPLICVDGDQRCVGTTLQVCKNNAWATQKTNATECGYEGGGGGVTPPAEGSWFDRNKTAIIVVSVIVLVIALVALLAKRNKLGVQSPVTLRSPIVHKGTRPGASQGGIV